MNDDQHLAVIEKVSSGIEGFDDITCGGLPFGYWSFELHAIEPKAVLEIPGGELVPRDSDAIGKIGFAVFDGLSTLPDVFLPFSHRMASRKWVYAGRFLTTQRPLMSLAPMNSGNLTLCLFKSVTISSSTCRRARTPFSRSQFIPPANPPC